MTIQNRQLYVSIIRPRCYMRLKQSHHKMSQNYAITLIVQIKINETWQYKILVITTINEIISIIRQYNK